MADYAETAKTPKKKGYPPELYSDILKMLRGLEYDVTKRNKYMRERYDAVYEDGLWRDLDIEGWFAQYNLLARVADIQTSQLMGRGFNVLSDYSKEDLGAYEGDEKQKMQLENKKRKANADLRVKTAKGIIRDNGDMALFEDGARIGSVLGLTVYKLFPDPDNKEVVISLIETPQNYYAGWNSDNFRKRDWDGYAYQISADSAYREYGDILEEGQMFGFSKEGSPFLETSGTSLTSDPINQNASDGLPSETEREMVTVIDVTGYFPGWTVEGGEIVTCKRGKEKPFSVLCVGGKPAEVITNPKHLPKYYKINNRQKPRAAWGEADINDSMIDINREIVRLMADSMSWADKNLWKVWLGKGMLPEALAKLKGKPRKQRVIAVGLDQDLTEMTTSTQPLSEMAKLVEQKLDLFVRLAGIGRVLFDDPTVNANSNQALMTTLKGVVDGVESKQKRWSPELAAMMRDALWMASEFVPGLKEALTDDPNWEIDIEWPSVLRREDATFQTMWLNLFNAGAISLETFLQQTVGGIAAEEIDRLRDELADPTTAAILGKQVPLLAQQLIQPPADPNTPPPPEIKYNVQVKADASLDPRANADLIRVVDPQLPDMGVGSAAKDGAMPTPDQAADPTLSADQNTGQSASQPGSGAPAVSPEGAVAQAAQNGGA